MDRETVIAKLRAHEEELKNAGVLHLSLFGSVACGAAGPDSDVDLIVEFDKSRWLTLIGAIGIENRIADLWVSRWIWHNRGTSSRVCRREQSARPYLSFNDAVQSLQDP